MPNAKGLKFGKQLLDLSLADMLDPCPAIARNHLERFWIRFQKSRHKRTPLFLKVLEHAAFVIETLLCIRTEKLFMDPSVIPNADNRTLGILRF
jgi:hypothetical protein